MPLTLAQTAYVAMAAVAQKSALLDLFANELAPTQHVRPVRLLFVCTGNSCRSQMAEAWARVLLGNACESHSAGITSHGLDAHAVTVMAEAGVDLSCCRSKTVDELGDLPFDSIITLSERAQAGFPYIRYDAEVMHAGFPAPRKTRPAHSTARDGLDEYRRVRDDIRAFVAALPFASRCVRSVSDLGLNDGTWQDPGSRSGHAIYFTTDSERVAVSNRAPHLTPAQV